jgi:hypothetical protein
MFGSLEIEIWVLPFDLAQGGEPVEPFVICYLVLEFSQFKDSIAFRDIMRLFK